MQSMLDERRAILDVLEGKSPLDSLFAEEDDEEEEEIDQFIEFVVIVDELLGKMSEEAVEKFVASDEFKLYKEVGSNPSSANEKVRGRFFDLVDRKLGEMPEDAISEFIQSDEFPVYQNVGAKYQG